MTALDIQTKQEREELVALATKIRDWQEARGLTTAALIRQYPDLGSDKTYGLLAKGEFAELDIDRWLISYRQAWVVMESLAEREAQNEEIYDDITACKQLRGALMEILQERGSTRFVLVEGDSGSGKTSTAIALQRKYGARVLIVEACDATGESPMALLGSILEALGCTQLPVSTAGRLSMVQRLLRNRRVCIIIDEAHHLGKPSLNTVKTLINTTPGEFVMLALPTLWRRLEHQAWEEVRQLTGNRLAQRIAIPAQLREPDVRMLLDRRAKVSDTAAVRMVAGAAKGNGNLQFVAQVARRLREMKLEGVPTLEHVETAISQQKRRRGES